MFTKCKIESKKQKFAQLVVVTIVVVDVDVAITIVVAFVLLQQALDLPYATTLSIVFWSQKTQQILTFQFCFQQNTNNHLL